MNKKVISCTVLFFSILVWIYFAFFFQSARSFSDLCVDEDFYQKLIETRVETEEELVLSMSFNDYQAVYDGNEKCFYYSLVEDHEKAYDPQIGFSAKDSKVKLAVKDVVISDEMIAGNVAIEVLAYDEAYYREYLIRCSTLPLLSIYFYEEPTDMDVDITFHLFDNRAEAQKRELTSEGRMRIRGVTTASYEKKGYKVTLLESLKKEEPEENQQPLLGMRSDGDWMLYAGYNDQEKIRNVFSANLWYESCADNNIFGVKNGMEYRYVEAFFNGHYVGLYALGFPIDELQLELQQPLSSDDISEFMLKKMTWVQEIETDDFYERTLESYEFQWGEDTLFTAENRAKSIEYHRLLDNGDRDDISMLYQLMDIGNAIDVYLFFNLIQGVDNAHEGDTKNLYLTYKSTGETGKFLITPWDFDLSWGNEYHWAASYATAQYTFGSDTNLIMDKNVVDVLLENGDENIRSLIVQRYEQLRENEWSEENMIHMLDVYEAQIFDSGAYAREQKRWPHGHYVERDQELSHFKEYVKERLTAMDDFVIFYCK